MKKSQWIIQLKQSCLRFVSSEESDTHAKVVYNWDEIGSSEAIVYIITGGKFNSKRKKIVKLRRKVIG